MSTENKDIHPDANTSWKDAWDNDYWGRPLSNDSSHKSWRPISIWSFRFGKGGTAGKWLVTYVGKGVGSGVDAILRVFGAGFFTSSSRLSGGASKSSYKGITHGNSDDGRLASELFVHRFVNVMIHAAIVQLVGAVATLLFLTGNGRNNEQQESNTQQQQQQQQRLHYYTKYISQILFAIHPTHVEAVANVANRPHILGLLFNATIVDPSVPLIAMSILATLGLLTAETAIFQFPAIVLTMTAVQYNRELFQLRNSSMEYEQKKNNEDDNTSSSSSSISQSTTTTSNKSAALQQKKSASSVFQQTIITLLPRYILLVFISVIYLLYRHYINNSLSIPIGLIRPAENPFYNKLEKDEWTIGHRAMNYSYILSLHIMKSIGVDVVGFSHEYGFDCIPEIKTLSDTRLLIPLAILGVVGGIFLLAIMPSSSSSSPDDKSCDVKQKSMQRQGEEERIHRVLLTLVFFSWMATLFPIAGILKVGTFVADRITVASTFGTCIFGGRLFAVLLNGGSNNGNDGADESTNTDEDNSSSRASWTKRRRYNLLALLCFGTFKLASRTHHRAAEWMDSVPLLESSVLTCPRSIKSNLEMSKLYSGLVPHLLDLERSLSLIHTAQSIDPEYCDVHQQYAHVYFHQSKYIPFEEEMVQSLMCPFTMGQAMNNWNKYWQVVLEGGKNKEASERYQRYMAEIQNEIARAEREEKMNKKRSSGKVGVQTDEL